MNPIIGLDEVIARAVAPNRAWHAIAAGGVAAIAVALVWRSFAPLPPMPPPPFESTCDPVETSLACAVVLPHSLVILPDRAQYADALTSDLVTAIHQPTSGSGDAEWRLDLLSSPFLLRLLEDPDAGLVRERVRAHARAELASRDPWAQAARRKALTDRLPYPVPIPELTPDVIDVLTIHDWSEPTPPLPALVSVEEIEARELPEQEHLIALAASLHNRIAREEIPPIAAEAAATYEDARRDALRAFWERSERGERAHAQRLAQRSAAEAEGQLLRLLALAASAVGLVFAGRWAMLRPQTIRLSPHRLQLGRRSFAWTDVTSCHWAELSPWVLTRHGPVSLPGRTLSADAVEALQAASVQAIERARRLEPLDRTALDALGQLRR